MAIEPDGASYELQLEAHVASQERLSRGMRAPTTARGPQLLSNKSQLVWGGVPLGRARQQSIVFKNVAEQMLKLTLEIRAPHDNFQVIV